MIENKGIYQGNNLPHYDIKGLYQVITYRLGDALPKDMTHVADDKTNRRVIDEVIDNGYGSCVLKIPLVAEIIIQNWQHFDKQKYDLIAYVVMPNHVHILINTNKSFSLGQIVHSWKSFTSKEITKQLKSSKKHLEVHNPGRQSDYWDRFLRSKEHYIRAVDYIHLNPVKAGLCRLPIDWPYSSFKKWYSN
ncbi:MAG: hypothetical protein COA79_19005 [Planctomycetota bacterium]|nr:MAG: hypothetical protein COA79_19005 [Planctomycetota bacterium]